MAEREGFVVVYPDGTGTIPTWNAGGCCGSAVRDDVNDVGFVAAILDRLEGELCLDRDRVFATGMSNGGMMSHRLGCELSERFAAVAPVAGTLMFDACTPTRPVHVMHVHGSDDGHVPWEGGLGCGPAGVPFTSVPDRGWR
ncbi:MAG: prolyl oligopeptidase family serine peptidase [Sandaracinus sp.]|nr:prolyl oligopeptidase family serine peptidase [Sandaracinus sp.]